MYCIPWCDVDDGAGYPALIRQQVQKQTETHLHEFFEIVYVHEGFCLHVCDSTSALLMAGDMVAIRPGVVHSYRGQRNVTISNFLFMPQALSGVLDEVCTLPGMNDFFYGPPTQTWLLHSHLSLPEQESVQWFLREFARERAEQRTGWMLRSKALLLEFMVRFSRILGVRFPAQQSDARYLGYVSAALAAVEAHYHEEISIAGIAADLKISPDHLTRQFRQTMGITPMEYLRRYRFARALELLRRQTPVSEVCMAVGFHHLSHFSREFKALFDMTPTAFQRQSREQTDLRRGV
ncbi:MAG: AraC family transcriptional regulator [Clostridia bacterium]